MKIIAKGMDYIVEPVIGHIMDKNRGKFPDPIYILSIYI